MVVLFVNQLSQRTEESTVFETILIGLWVYVAMSHIGKNPEVVLYLRLGEKKT